MLAAEHLGCFTERPTISKGQAGAITGDVDPLNGPLLAPHIAADRERVLRVQAGDILGLFLVAGHRITEVADQDAALILFHLSTGFFIRGVRRESDDVDHLAPPGATDAPG